MQDLQLYAGQLVEGGLLTSVAIDPPAARLVASMKAQGAPPHPAQSPRRGCDAVSLCIRVLGGALRQEESPSLSTTRQKRLNAKDSDEMKKLVRGGRKAS